MYRVKPCRLNRTFMELKHPSCVPDAVLLACLNRTFMELKLCRDEGRAADGAVLIVPLWN